MSTQEIRLTQHVAASAEDVWAVLTDIAHADDNLSGIEAVEVLTPGPYSVGFRWRETRRMMGMTATEEMEVTALEPLRRSEVTARNGEVTYHTVHSLVEKPGGTDLVMEFGMEMPAKRGITRLMNAAMAKVGFSATRKVMEQDLQDIAVAAELRHG